MVELKPELEDAPTSIEVKELTAHPLVSAKLELYVDRACTIDPVHERSVGEMDPKARRPGDRILVVHPEPAGG